MTDDRNGRLFARAGYALLCLLVSLLVTAIFVNKPGINGYKPAMYGDMIYGEASKPFVYRALLPAAVRAVVSVIPDRVQTWAVDVYSVRPDVRNFFHEMRWERMYIVEYAVGILLMYAALWGFFFAFRCLTRAVCDASPGLVDAASVLALLALPPFFKYYSYLYDFPALFFFTFGLALLVRRKWTLYFVVFFLGCFNKETTILLFLVFCIHFLKRRRLSSERFMLFGSIQLLIFGFAKAFLAWAFKDNPGSAVEFHLIHNFQLLSPYPLSTFLAWLVVAVFVARNWREKPEFLRDAVWIVVPLVALTLVFGLFDELRDYYEAFPIVFLLMMWSVADLFGVKVKCT